MFQFPKSLQVGNKKIPFVFGTGQKFSTIDHDPNQPDGYIPSWQKRPEVKTIQHDKEDHSGYLYVTLRRVMRVSPIYNGGEFANSFSVTLMTRAEHAITNGADDSLGLLEKAVLKIEKMLFESGRWEINTRDMSDDDNARHPLEKKAAEEGVQLHNVPIHRLPMIFMMAQRVYAEAGDMPPPERKGHYGVPMGGL